MCGFTPGMSRIAGADRFGSRREESLERLTREYLDTSRRFGDSTVDPEPFPVHRPPPLVAG